jgi:hypothetical protein
VRAGASPQEAHELLIGIGREHRDYTLVHKLLKPNGNETSLSGIPKGRGDIFNLDPLTDKWNDNGFSGE